MRSSSTSSMFKRLDVSPENLKKKQEETAANDALTITQYLEIAHSDIISPYISDTEFNYETISSIAFKSNGKYRSLIKSKDGYISFALSAIDRNLPENTVIREKGVKIHISLDDAIPDNIANGWNAIVGILQYYDVARIKIAHEGNIKTDVLLEPYQRGKQITLYICLHPDHTNFANLLSSITQALIANHVAPGYRPHPDSSRAVEGNCYLSYRCDWDPIAKKDRKAKDLDGAFPLAGVDDNIKIQCEQAAATIQTPGLQPKSSISNSTETMIDTSRLHAR